MAEEPRVFTLAPWGYRLLPALLARLVPLPPAAAYAVLTPLALFTAGLLLFLWLRRLGHGSAVACVATAVFVLSPPVRHALRYSVLTEPVAVALEVAFLLALASAAPAVVLAFLLLLGVMAKEVLLLLLAPLLLTVRGAWRQALAVAAPSLAWLALIRWRWPAAQEEATVPSPGTALPLLLATASEWGPMLMLVGVLPLALLALTRPSARAFVVAWGWVLLPGLALPFVAGLYVPGSDAAPMFYAADVERLLVYPLPVLLALAAHLAGPPALSEPVARRPLRAAWALVALVVASPLALDGYRRHDLSGPRDGPRLLALCRGSLATARRLASGRPVIWRFPDHGYQPGRMAPEYLDRTRWFLLDGWGERAYFGLQPVVFQADTATLLVPVVDTRRGLEVAVALHTTVPLTLGVTVNGQAVHQVQLPPGESRPTWHVPPGMLVRGDNVMTLTAPGAAAARLSVERLGLHPTER